MIRLQRCARGGRAAPCCSSRSSRRRGSPGRRRCRWPRSWRTWSSGHNIMHGQWDWMRDPKIHSTTWEWDHACASEGWKKSHNFEHHTYTNVLGKDRDLGYSIMRVSADQRWHPAHLMQPVYDQLLALVLRVGRGVLRPRVRPGPGRHASPRRRSRRDADAPLAQGPPPAREGLRPVPGAVRARGLPGGARREPRRQHRPQLLGARRDLLRALPGGRRDLPRGAARGRDPRASGTCGR